MRFSIYADFNVYSSTYNWQKIHDPENFPSDIYGSPIEQNHTFAYNISMEKELGRAGSLTFTIDNGHPQYNNMFPLGVTIAVTTPTEIDVTTTDIVTNPSANPIVIDGTSTEVAVGKQVEYDDKHYVYRKDSENVYSWHEYQDIGHVIWIGRILTIERTFNLELNITCEGALAFLNDIMVRPRQFYAISGLNQGKTYAVSAITVLQDIYNEYIARVTNKGVNKRLFGNLIISTPVEQIDEVDDNLTPITEGSTVSPVYDISIIPNAYVNAERSLKMKSNGHAYIFNGKEWESYDVPPGYINQTTYTEIPDYVTTLDKILEIANLEPSVGVWAECEDDTTYLPYIHFMYLPNTRSDPHIVFAKNLADFQDNGDGMDIYNAVIPLGTNKIMLNPTDTSRSGSSYHQDTNYEYWINDNDSIDASDITTASPSMYGYIEKTIDYSDASTSQELLQIAQANLEAYINRYGKSFNVNAVDLALLSEVHDDGYMPFLLEDEHITSEDYNPNNFINIGDGVWLISDPHNIEYSSVKLTCSSLRMDIDNPGASSFTFQVYDNNYVPLKPKLLTEQEDKLRAIAEGKIAKDGTIYRQSKEPSTVYKKDDNTVVASYGQKDSSDNYTEEYEEIYTSTGSGDVREDLASETYAPGTTAIPTTP